MDMLVEFMESGEKFGDFSSGTLTVVLTCALLSFGAGIASRRMIFPRLMDALSKIDGPYVSRIEDGNPFAPKSLRWMVVFFVMWYSLDWLSAMVVLDEGGLRESDPPDQTSRNCNVLGLRGVGDRRPRRL